MATDDDLGPLLDDDEDEAGPWGPEGDPRHLLPHVFARRALPDLLFHDPLVSLAMLGREDAGDTLRDFWDFVRERVDPGHDSPEPGPDAFSVRAFRLDGFVVALIRLPEPEQPPGAYFAAFAVAVDPEALDPVRPPDTPPPARYLTLEKTPPLGPDSPGAVLRGRAPDGTHRDLGLLIPPDLDAFADAVVEHLLGRPDS
ncbi:hypothetical protein [Tautonia plasticadhaerens]|uniref:Uncharacterized protein n=1 Tax=Tautonia plasticadhaerens TaxID=2527974 RepID=A0A518HDX2_9BACT|nr:hypothetical protein [Tautonia plasticadhaerens]QDV38906.1 hypothetical protein ElP_68660 [Tautonia plasticadhaerens]